MANSGSNNGDLRGSRLGWAVHAIRNGIETHLEESQVTYGEHLGFALKASARLAYASFASVIHAFVPAMFPATSARIVIELYKERLEFHPNPRYQEMMHGTPSDVIRPVKQAAE